MITALGRKQPLLSRSTGNSLTPNSGCKSLLWHLQLCLKSLAFSPMDLPTAQVPGGRGGNDGTCNKYNKGLPCARDPCLYKHLCNKPGCLGAHPGFRCTNDKPPQPREEPPSDKDQRSSARKHRKVNHHTHPGQCFGNPVVPPPGPILCTETLLRITNWG